jgi:hypothetical protein
MSVNRILHILRSDQQSRDAFTLHAANSILSLPIEAQVDGVEFGMLTKAIEIPITASFSDVKVVRELLPQLAGRHVTWRMQGSDGHPAFGIVGFLGSHRVVMIGIDKSGERLRLAFISTDESG